MGSWIGLRPSPIFYDSVGKLINALNNKNDSSLNYNKTGGGVKKDIYSLSKSKIAAQNKRDEKQDFNNLKEDEIDSADQEFDFLSKDLDDLDDNLNSNTNYCNCGKPNDTK